MVARTSLPFNCGSILKATVEGRSSWETKSLSCLECNLARMGQKKVNVDFRVRCSPMALNHNLPPSQLSLPPHPDVSLTFQTLCQFPKYRNFFHPLVPLLLPLAGMLFPLLCLRTSSFLQGASQVLQSLEASHKSSKVD